MGLSFGAPGIPAASPVTSSAVQTQPAAQGASGPSSMALAQQVALGVLMPSSSISQQAFSIYVARSMIPPPRESGSDICPKDRLKNLRSRSIKISKSEAMGQQTKQK